MPKSHQAHLEWTPSRLIHWAETVGEATAQVVRMVLEKKPHPEMGYRACMRIIGLGKTYSNQRLEAASKRALELGACSYQSLKSILRRSLDRQTTLPLEPERPGPRHENVRGAHYCTIRRPLCCSNQTPKGKQHVKSTDDGEVARHETAWNGRRLPRSDGNCRHEPARIRGALCAAGGPAVALERESGAGAPSSITPV